MAPMMMPILAPELSPLLAAAAFDVLAGGGGVAVVEGEVEDEAEVDEVAEEDALAA